MSLLTTAVPFVHFLGWVLTISCNLETNALRRLSAQFLPENKTLVFLGHPVTVHRLLAYPYLFGFAFIRHLMSPSTSQAFIGQNSSPALLFHLCQHLYSNFSHSAKPVTILSWDFSLSKIWWKSHFYNFSLSGMCMCSKRSALGLSTKFNW